MLTPGVLRLRDQCLRAQVREADFWHMTIGEAVRECDAYHDRLKDTAYFSYMTASAIGLFIGSVFSSKSPPEISDIYPEFFPKAETREATEERQEELKEERSVANFLKFAYSFNQRFENGNRKPESENNG